MNYIFDIGNVLIDYKPKEFLAQLFPCQATANKIMAEIFLSQEWIKLDQGLLTHALAYEIFCQRNPALAPQIRHTMGQIKQMLTPMPATIALLPKIKNAGHNLYYLSNYHTELSQHILATNSFFKLFDGGVFSCEIHINKPHPQIYRELLTRYNLTHSECIFYDDTEENVAAAQAEGIPSVLFTGADCVVI
ncbi:MAG: HAD family phosphatase [Defluviitaleaceae bacterium]|nr:HAD family phosphatase [Defluviitaleaceae bacterium]